jgi:hypothetical protein
MMKLSSGGELEASVDRKIVKDREGFGVVLQSPIALFFVSVSLCLCKFIVCGKKVCSFLVSSYIVAVEENVRQPQVFFPFFFSPGCCYLSKSLERKVFARAKSSYEGNEEALMGVQA